MTLILGISGGPDSVYLLYRLLKKGQRPILAHFNHKLRREESDADEIFVKKLAKQHHLPCEIESVDVRKWAKTHKKSLEEAGRMLRYDFLERVRQKHNAQAIFIAHTLDDNLETVLLNKTRGCGLKGLIGMQPKNGFLRRPLLNTRKATILAFLSRKKIPYRIDSSNQDLTFTRNRMRLVTIPRLLKKSPNLFKDFQNERRQALKHYKALQKETKSWLSHQAWSHARSVSGVRSPHSLPAECAPPRHEAPAECPFPLSSPAFSFSTKSFLQLSQEKRHFLLQYLYEYFYKSTYNLSRTLIREIEKLIQNDRTGKTKKFGPEVKVETAYHQVYFKNPESEQEKVERAKANVVVSLSNHTFKNKPIPKIMVRDAPFGAPHHDKTPFSDLNFSLIPNGIIKVRSFKPGDRFQPSGMQGTKKLQDFFTDLKIPREKRHTIPVFTTQDNIIIAVGTRLDEKFRKF